MNILGMIVVSGNVRRSAQIAIGDFDDVQYLRARTGPVARSQTGERFPTTQSCATTSPCCHRRSGTRTGVGLNHTGLST
jgi:hypothetical protein